jgi:uncharacterized protein
MKVVVAGGTGWLGSALCRSMDADGHDVVVLSRTLGRGGEAHGPRRVVWDGRSVGAWAAELEDADAVINLSGESVMDGRWSEERKRALVASRVEPTTAIVGAIKRAQNRPGVLVNASAVGYYGDKGDQPVTESDPPGNDFLARLVVEWEQAAMQAVVLGVRVCTMRIGIVLGPGGGALAQLALPFRFFLGGYVGSGKQWISWVHIDDVVGLFRFAVERADATGAINVTAPEPATNRQLAQTLGSVLGRPSWVPAPAFALRIVLGELAESLLVGQRVLPAAAQQLGYRFQHPALESALRGALRAAA